ncbi:MAG: hypothetical protein KDA62_21365, partial [Planctomycetales bacterium]|nr:hypothetical protein [Planctomycetales bacterium]
MIRQTNQFANQLTGLIIVAALASGDAAAAAEPILAWRFDGTASAGEWLGKFGSSAPGPRPPKYPGFQSDNSAMAFNGHEGAILVKDHERGGFTNIRFDRGDTFGFETWVKFSAIAKGQIAYVMGKGRHVQHGEEFADDNQNYSIRFQGTSEGAQFGLLFTSEHPGTKQRAWHRWWSDPSVPITGWHHVALEFTFGKRDSLRAYIDGKPV